MTTRSPETILAEWRVAEAMAAERTVSDGLATRIEQLRREHAAAIRDRREEAQSLARQPWDTTTADRS
jgi:hypothetical protein